MSETTMPAAEAAVDTSDERVSYELAFHVLPTVAEGEVTQVEEAITALITNAGGTLGLTEPAQRFDLAYELQKLIDGKYRRFTTAYFGWIRFNAEPSTVAELLQEVEAHPSVLRALLVRLTRQEEEHPFFLHEVLASRKPVTDIDVSAASVAATDAEADTDDVDTDTDEDDAADSDAATETIVAADDGTIDTSDTDESAAAASDDDAKSAS